MNYRMICYLIGRILLVEAALMLLPLSTALIYSESPLPFLVAMAGLAVTGLLLSRQKPGKGTLYARDGFAVVALVWLLGADEQVMCMTLLATGSALGLNTVVIPAAYGGDTRTGAAMAMISHVLCIVTIPLLYALLTWLV